MSTSGRLTICNMSVEAGATSGIVPADQETVRYLREEAGVKDPIELVTPDADARYDRVVEIDAARSRRRSPARTRWTTSSPSTRWPAPRSTRS